MMFHSNKDASQQLKLERRKTHRKIIKMIKTEKNGKQRERKTRKGEKLRKITILTDVHN